eukprot:2479138-Amphidinium_carterae.1
MDEHHKLHTSQGPLVFSFLLHTVHSVPVDTSNLAQDLAAQHQQHCPIYSWTLNFAQCQSLTQCGSCYCLQSSTWHADLSTDEYEVLDRTPKLYEVEDLPIKPVPEHFTGSLKVVMMIEKIDQMIDMQVVKQHATNDTLHELGLPAGFAAKMPECSMQFARVAAQTGWLLVKFPDFDKRCSVSQLKALADASKNDRTGTHCIRSNCFLSTKT